MRPRRYAQLLTTATQDEGSMPLYKRLILDVGKSLGKLNSDNPEGSQAEHQQRAFVQVCAANGCGCK